MQLLHVQNQNNNDNNTTALFFNGACRQKRYGPISGQNYRIMIYWL